MIFEFGGPNKRLHFGIHAAKHFLLLTTTSPLIGWGKKRRSRAEQEGKNGGETDQETETTRISWRKLCYKSGDTENFRWFVRDGIAESLLLRLKEKQFITQNLRAATPNEVIVTHHKPKRSMNAFKLRG